MSLCYSFILYRQIFFLTCIFPSFLDHWYVICSFHISRDGSPNFPSFSYIISLPNWWSIGLLLFVVSYYFSNLSFCVVTSLPSYFPPLGRSASSSSLYSCEIALLCCLAVYKSQKISLMCFWKMNFTVPIVPGPFSHSQLWISKQRDLLYEFGPCLCCYLVACK